METTIIKNVKGSTMSAIFDNSELFSVRFFEAKNLEKEADFKLENVYKYEILIRHEEGTDANVLFEEERFKAEILNSPATPSPLPETETGVSIDTPTEAGDVFEYLDGADGNFASEIAPKGWETGAPPTPGNERQEIEKQSTQLIEELKQDWEEIKTRMKELEALEALEAGFYMAICRAYNAGKQNVIDDAAFISSYEYFKSEFPGFTKNVPCDY